jgi:hypothetical protein
MSIARSFEALTAEAEKQNRAKSQIIGVGQKKLIAIIINFELVKLETTKKISSD